MKFSVCIGAVFNGKDVEKSMQTIKELGIDTIEFWSWWDQDLETMLRVKEELGMNISAFCTRFISLTDESQRSLYIEALKETLQVAKRMGTKMIISQVGNELPGVPRRSQHESIVNGLKECAPILESEGITLVYEPLNTLVNHKGYYLYSSDEAFQICEEVGSPNVKVLYDVYHQQIMDGNLISRITSNIDKIGHFHGAGNPGRHELDNGEINYTSILKAIDETGFKGYMGLEYFPLEDPVKGLKRLMELKVV
jgi:hydroxypyruvate isomerase